MVIRAGSKRTTSTEKRWTRDTSQPGGCGIIQSEEKNRNLWKLGIVEGLFRGRDGVVWGAKVRTVNGQLERAVQHL